MKIKTEFYLRSYVLLQCVAIIGYLSSCDNDPEANPAPSIQGEVRDKGAALGDQEQFTIDANGGQIVSADGFITLNFPAGAVPATTTVTLQKIENTTPNGLGYAFRLSPHEKFNAPVGLTIKYPLDSVSLVDAVGIAYQDDAGIWNAVRVTDHNRKAQTISIETMHFSDWSVFQSVKISPTLSIIKPGDQVTLIATATFKGEELLTPLVGDPKPLGTTPLDENYISSWSLEGPGTLTPLGNVARYKAVNEFRSDVAEVNLSLNVPGAPVSVANATIVTGGSSVTFSGGPYADPHTVLGFATAMYHASNNTTIIGFKGTSPLGDFSVVLGYHGKGPGIFPWSTEKDNESGVVSEHNYPGGTHIGTIGALGKDNGHHLGSITIDAFQPPGKFVFGSFQGGYTYMRQHCVECMTEGSISGNFIAKRYQ